MEVEEESGGGWDWAFPLDITQHNNFKESLRRANQAIDILHVRRREGMASCDLDEPMTELAYHVKSVMIPMMARHKSVVPMALHLSHLHRTKAPVIKTSSVVLAAYEAAVLACTRAYRGQDPAMNVVQDAVARVEAAVKSEESRREEMRRTEEVETKRREADQQLSRAKREAWVAERDKHKPVQEGDPQVRLLRRLEYLEKRKVHLEESICIEKNRKRLKGADGGERKR